MLVVVVFTTYASAAVAPTVHIYVYLGTNERFQLFLPLSFMIS
jgi:hypothetical protein